jgi:hypothetical protein
MSGRKCSLAWELFFPGWFFDFVSPLLILPPSRGRENKDSDYSFLSGKRRTLLDLHLGQTRSCSPFLASVVILYSKPQWRHLSCSSISITP